jgi:hypothetical protein
MVVCIKSDVLTPACRPSVIGVTQDMPTIVPFTPEAEWLPGFVDLADWELPVVPTLVLAPHPDDETLGAGGLTMAARLSSRPRGSGANSSALRTLPAIFPPAGSVMQLHWQQDSVIRQKDEDGPSVDVVGISRVVFQDSCVRS